MQAGVVVAKHNKLPFKEEDNAFDNQWDNHNILTWRWQSSAHYHQPVMGMICRLMADKLRLKLTWSANIHWRKGRCVKVLCLSIYQSVQMLEWKGGSIMVNLQATKHSQFHFV
jgi:hypothetical protein